MNKYKQIGNSISNFYYVHGRLWLLAMFWLCALICFSYMRLLIAAIDASMNFSQEYIAMQNETYACWGNVGLLFFVVLDYILSRGKTLQKDIIILSFLGIGCICLINRWSPMYASNYLQEHYQWTCSFNYAYIPHLILLGIMCYIREKTLARSITKCRKIK